MTQADIVLDALIRHAQSHPHLTACWLKGSQARGDADAYSDIDLHLLVTEEHVEAFRYHLAEWLSELYPVVRFHILFGGYMVGTILQTAPEEITLVDLFLETDPAPQLWAGQHRLLWDRTGTLALNPEHVPALSDLQQEFRVAVEYFWTLYHTVTKVGRGELIASVGLMTYLAEQLAIVCGLGRGITRQVGGGHLNSLLTEPECREIERLLALNVVDRVGVMKATEALAAMMREKGRVAAFFLNTAYPLALEEVIVRDVQRKLAR